MVTIRSSRIIFLALLLVTTVIRAQVSHQFTFSINGTAPAGFTTALAFAAQRWSEALHIPVPVKLNVFTVNSSQLPFSGVTLANGRRNFQNAPRADVLYPTALANQLAGTETNPDEFDMDIYFNLAMPFHYGKNAPPGHLTDFITLAMHEIGHGLGFYSNGYVNSSGNGSFGNIPASAIFPIMTSFPWPGTDTVPSIFDQHITRKSGAHLITCAPQNSSMLGDSIMKGPHFFYGPAFSIHANGGQPLLLSGGAGTFNLGVDLLHLHSSNSGALMSYSWGKGDTVRTPKPYELALLSELGWSQKISGLQESDSPPKASVLEKNGLLIIESLFGEEVSVEAFNLQGQSLGSSDSGKLEINLPTAGIYFYRIRPISGSLNYAAKIVVTGQ